METLTYPATAPRVRNVNIRLLAFLAIICTPILWGAYVGARTFFNNGVEDHGDYKKVDLKALGFFQFDQNNGTIADVPNAFRKLDGQRVMLEGFMWTPSSAARVKDFQFVYNVNKCCFSGPPLVQERVFVHIPNGKSLPLISDYVRVVGTLHVDVKKNEDGVITSVYTMDLEKADRAA